jgi:tetratricopeptide (TPR) repeat protein
MKRYSSIFVRYFSVLVLISAVCVAAVGQSADGVALETGLAQIAGDIERALPAGTRIAITNFDSPSARFSAYIMEELEGVLIQRRKLMVVSHRQAEEILNEVNYQLSGNVSDETAVLIGHAIGAEVIITGSLTDLGGKYRFRFGAINIESSVWQVSTSATILHDSTIAYLLPANNSPPPAVVPARPDSELATRYFNAGFAHYEAKEYQKAIADFNRVLEITRDDTNTLFYRSYSYHEIKGYDDAIAGYTELIRLKPDNALYYNNRGAAYRAKGDNDLAIADYSQAIRINPNYVYAYNNRGVAYKAKGNNDLAIADYSQAIRIDPNYTAAYNNRGLAYRAKGDNDLAIADYSQAIRIDPNYTDAYNNRGNAYLAKGNNDLAIADYSQAIRIDPNYVYAYHNRGLAYYNKKDYDRAIVDYTQAIRINSNYAAAYYWRGNAEKAKGNQVQADRDFAEAKRLGYTP